MVKTIVNMENVSFHYGNRQALSKINFQINEGDFIGLVGPNGGGKTTLIKLILGLEKPSAGNLTLFGVPAQKYKQKSNIGYVSQKANTFNRGFPATVTEVVAMGLTAKLGYFKRVSKQVKVKVEEAIEQVGMSAYKNENIGNLSGGQQQRIFIARALVSKPKLLILDEPTVGVDAENVEKFFDLLHDLNKQNITLLLVTHDIGTMTHHASQVVCLNKTLHFHGNPSTFESLSKEQLSDFYGHPLNLVTHHH
ncbi:zinc transport system ATP-binding protein [Gracilibacillus ureilyticus]|uniref:Zinc transport system ATP-binding protein n=1 Tax=Gracilibacillus ureilyticus TaxID=531814 RepID=A0A1H9S313_9BACI|nr:metal ABC transporter ATP-binding protein [Gracilibacillus ureilyticus]SER79015.1 zinc transport system ATP-binding protein [Gracilibacillus ureilyticus]